VRTGVVRVLEEILRIAVIGAGIVGVTTAYELARDGHKVVVLERRQSVASEASSGNAGVVAPGYVSPWATPWMPLKVLAGQLRQDRAVRLGRGVLSQPGWIWRYLWACRSSNYQANRQRMQRLALYSRQRLDLLTRAHGLAYEQRRGYMVLLRNARELARAERTARMLADMGMAHELLDAPAARAREPALAANAPVHAALALPNDLVGNCRQFAHELKSQAQAMGVDFRFGAELVHLSKQHPGGLVWQPIDGQHSIFFTGSDKHTLESRSERYDAIVLCTGQPPQALLKLGVRLPVAAVHGYSITAPIRHREGEPDPGPRSGVMDERLKVSISRMGDRIRAAGIAELGVAREHQDPAALATLYRALDIWYPGAAETAKAQQWKGTRPMLPDGPPLIGQAGPPGLWLNLGHGGSGWALACGSARVLADRIAKRTPDIDIEGLGLERLR
jgi:D-amino-acid dehydrogenase